MKFEINLMHVTLIFFPTHPFSLLLITIYIYFVHCNHVVDVIWYAYLIEPCIFRGLFLLGQNMAYMIALITRLVIESNPLQLHMTMVELDSSLLPLVTNAMIVVVFDINSLSNLTF
jgi:hypothetical protein